MALTRPQVFEGRPIPAVLLSGDHKRIEAWRRADTMIVAAMCDGLARLFSNDVTPLALARQAGLKLVNAVPPVKRFFLEQAAGTAGRQPTLMTGGHL